MIRLFAALVMLATGAQAQVAVAPERSEISDGWRSLRIELGLAQIVPYRVFTLDDPRRLVLDLQGVEWNSLEAAALVDSDRVSAVRFGPMRPGWGRMVLDLAEPLGPQEVEMRQSDAGADLRVLMRPVSAEAFAASAGAPPDPGWEDLAESDPMRFAPAPEGVFTVVIDAGHGGIDPGAERGGVREADLMLVLAQEVAAQINGEGDLRAIKTREQDSFVSLSGRITLARAAGADLFISLHADALEVDEARGASVYTLATGGGDAATQRMVERHERGDLLAGVDLELAEDRVAAVLMDMARARTGPQGEEFADVLVAELRRAGVPLNSRPRRQGQLAVLAAADFPAVLLETGFLSNSRDRALLVSEAGRARLRDGIAMAITRWARDRQ